MSELGDLAGVRNIEGGSGFQTGSRGRTLRIEKWESEMIWSREQKVAEKGTCGRGPEFLSAHWLLWSPEDRRCQHPACPKCAPWSWRYNCWAPRIPPLARGCESH